MHFPPDHRVSPAFEPFLAASVPGDKHEAIVIYDVPPPDELPRRRRIRNLKQRLEAIRTAATAGQHVQDEVLSSYQDAVRKHVDAPDLAVRGIGHGGLPAAVVEVTRETLPILEELSDVLAVLPNQPVQLTRTVTTTFTGPDEHAIKAGMTWGLERLQTARMWETTRAAGITVAVLDTGVYADHPALRGRIKSSIFVDPLRRRIACTPMFDTGEHGTHVCGTIAGGQTMEGVSIGVAPAAQLLVAGVLEEQCDVYRLLEGIAWSVENGADIINMSVGVPYYDPQFARVFESLLRSDILPVVAIGNDSHGNSRSPGNVYNAFSIGAAELVDDTSGECVVAPFSSGASLVFPGAGPEAALVRKPDVVAPGVGIYSCIPPRARGSQTYAYNYMDGSSMAAPHVAGIAALLMAAVPGASAGEIVEVLRDTAEHPRGTRLRPDNRWGYGIIRPVEALSALRS